MLWWVKKKNCFLFFCLFCSVGKSQSFFPDSLHKKSLRRLIFAESVTYTGAMTSLYLVWYKNQMSSSFRFFDDSKEWMGMDKAGHVLTTAYLCESSTLLYRSTGLNQKKSLLIGTTQGFLFQASLEIFDGFSNGYGFSWADMSANTVGAGLFLAQELSWQEQRIRLKFSSSPSELAVYRPALLGSNFAEQLLKDYNGQTYWLSGNISSFLKEESKFPKWINVAFGYGVDGLLGGKENPIRNEAGTLLPLLNRERQYYFSADIDFSRIPTKRKWFYYTLRLLNFVKIPFPAIEVSGKVWRIRPLYF